MISSAGVFIGFLCCPQGKYLLIILSYFNTSHKKKRIASILTCFSPRIVYKAISMLVMQLYSRLVILTLGKTKMVVRFQLTIYKRNIARRWHVVAHNRQNEHQEHERSSHIVLRGMNAHGGLFVIIFTCVGLAKINTENQQIMQIVRTCGVRCSRPWPCACAGVSTCR